MSSRRKSPVSRSMLVLLCVGICIGMLTIPGCGAEDSANIDLYGLFPTSGGLSAHGQAGKAAFELAVSNINSFLDATGSEVRVTGHVKEMSTDPQSAVEEIAALQDGGVPLLVTYMSSSQATAALDEINAGEMVLLTGGCSSPSLSVPGDNIMRLNTDDADEARTASKYFQEKGYTKIVPIARDDVWGRGLIEEASAALPDGITMDEGVWYGEDESDFAEYVSLLDQKVGALLASADPAEVVVYAVTFEELGSIMEEAAEPGHENLAKVVWFGADGNAAIPELTGASGAAEYALARDFIAVEYAWDYDTPEVSVVDALESHPGTTGYAMGIYDGTWLAFEALLVGAERNSESIKETVRVMATKYHGIGESYALNEADDKFIGILTLCGLAEKDGAIQWKDVAHVAIWADSADPAHIGIYPVEELGME